MSGKGIMNASIELIRGIGFQPVFSGDRLEAYPTWSGKLFWRRLILCCLLFIFLTLIVQCAHYRRDQFVEALAGNGGRKEHGAAQLGGQPVAGSRGAGQIEIGRASCRERV